MTKKDYNLIADTFWRSKRATAITTKNKVKLKAGEDMRRLLAFGLIGSLRHNDTNFDENKFLEDCDIPKPNWG
jgi:hypothetical protein